MRLILLKSSGFDECPVCDVHKRDDPCLSDQVLARDWKMASTLQVIRERTSNFKPPNNITEVELG